MIGVLTLLNTPIISFVYILWWLLPHQQKVISKRNPAPFEQQRVSVPIEE